MMTSSQKPTTSEPREDANELGGALPSVPEGRLYPRGFLPMWTEARDAEQAIYGLAYILQQIQATNTYRPNIGQVTAATSSLEFAIRALSGSLAAEGAPAIPDQVATEVSRVGAL